MSAATWFRESKWALLAVVVLVPAAVGVAFVDRFQPYLAAKNVQPLTASAGETVRFAGSDFTLTDLRLVDGGEAGAPEGRDAVVATWRVEIVEPPDFGTCDSAVVATVDGVERRWLAESSSSGLDLDIDDDAKEFCLLNEAGRFELVQTYLVPAGVLDEVAVEVTSPSESPVALRFTE